MAKKPSPEPKRKLTDPEFDSYDNRDFALDAPNPEAQARQDARVDRLRKAVADLD